MQYQTTLEELGGKDPQREISSMVVRRGFGDEIEFKWGRIITLGFPDRFDLRYQGVKDWFLGKTQTRNESLREVMT